MAACDSVPPYNGYVFYTVFFTDEAEYNYYVSIIGGTSLIQSPDSASVLFGAPRLDGPPMNPDGSTGWANSPGKGIIPTSGGWTVVLDSSFPSITLTPGFPSATIPCKSNGPYLWPARTYYWVGGLVLVTPAPEIPDEETTAPVPKRRWITGFEYSVGAEGGGDGGFQLSRDASRTIDGVGATIRSSTNKTWLRPVDVYRTGFTTHDSWERFYVRVRAFDPTNRIDIWKSVSTPSGNSGIRLYINTDGTVNVYNVTSAAVETLIDTTPVLFLTDIFVRIDIIINYNSAAAGGSGRFRMWANGEAVVDETVVAASGGLGQVSSFHSQSRLGTQQLAAANVWELDFDDWINSDVPEVDGEESLTSIDWFLGSHVKAVRVNSAVMTNWTGVSENFNGMMSPANVSAGNRMTSSTSGAQLRGLTNLDDSYALPSVTGLVVAQICSIISKYGARGAASGSLGYNLAGTGDVLTAIVEGAANQHNTVAYLGTGTDIIPQIMFPFTIIHQKGASADLATAYALSAVLEEIGIWGFEDNPLDTQLPNEKYLIHNGAFWANSPWAGLYLFDGIACTHSGTYVGNDTQQIIEVANVPFHFLFVRPLTGGSTNGFRWFATGLTGHLASNQGSTPETPIHVFWDNDLETANFAVSGTNADINANGVVYQYIAFCDPGGRFNMCGAFLQPAATASKINTLYNPTFTPDACFTQFEQIASASSVTRLAYKGPGNATDTGTRVDGTALADYLEFAAGQITSKTDAHAGIQTTFSAWRNSDITSDDVMVQILSYVGDGASPRNITLTPTSGRFPLLAIVIPHSGAEGFFRDPSHAANQCGNLNTSGNTVANAITGGGIDFITVGATLNSLGVTYEVFVFPGSNLAWEQFNVCSNNLPPLLPPPPPTPPLPDIAVLAEGGLILGGSTPLSMVKDASGIYTLVPGKRHDTFYERMPDVTEVDVAIPDPNAKTGYIGG